ncbi:MAG: hypothetical protein A2X48_22560 [Lentisphaerae bacterium GWF2_49_21]|nr:MAG: hypothetical protein A2X48_22560 [Lentisphaerae bacterium GWF2_49_21]
MKLAVALWGFREMPLDKIIESCPQMGIRRLEAQLHSAVPLHFDAKLLSPDTDRILSLANSKGVSFVSLATANDFTLEQDKLEAEMAYVREAIRFAARINVSILRIFSGFEPRNKVCGKTFDRMVAALAKSAGYASEHNVRLALENHGGIASTAEDMLKILSAVNSPNLFLNFDPANFVAEGVDCIRAFELLKDRIIYVHLKDVRTSNGHKEFCAVGEGMIDWRKLLSLLEDRYNGVCAIEYENAEDPVEGTTRSREFISKIVKCD